MTARVKPKTAGELGALTAQQLKEERLRRPWRKRLCYVGLVRVLIILLVLTPMHIDPAGNAKFRLAEDQGPVAVGGFTAGKGSRLRLSALLLGAYRNGKLHYFGHSGSGFSEKGIDDALHRMQPLFTGKSPFENPPKVKEKIQWIQSKLVCEVAYARNDG